MDCKSKDGDCSGCEMRLSCEIGMKILEDVPRLIPAIYGLVSQASFVKKQLDLSANDLMHVMAILFAKYADDDCCPLEFLTVLPVAGHLVFNVLDKKVIAKAEESGSGMSINDVYKSAN